MADKSLKDKTAKGLLWGGLSNGMVQILNAVFGIYLLNLLTPHDYGMVQVLNVFSCVAASLQESGFIAALANKKNPTHKDYNAVFWFNILCGSFLYVLLFFLAPYIADFYDEPRLTPLARFLFLSFLITSFGIAQRAYLFGHLMVKQTSIISVLALLISGVASIIMAYNGFAYWGLAAQGVLYVTVIVIMNWYYSPWRPTMQWDFGPIREMFGFSSKLLITSLFTQVNRNVLSTLLGKYYNTNVAGQYGNANKWNEMGFNMINGMISGVAQPVLAQVKDERQQSIHVFRKMLRFTCFIAFPAMLGLGYIAHEFILITVGTKWLESASLLSMLCVYGAFVPVNTLYYILVISQGKSNINMINTIVSCVLIWALMIGLHSYGLYVMVKAFIAVNVLWTLVWHYFAWRLIRISLWDVIKDIVPFAAITVVSIALSWLVTFRIENNLLLLISKILTTAVFYVGILYVSNANILRESMQYIFKNKKHKS
ncbi:lipopolysaccharide biosynthesis protein [Bacteroides sp. OF04-15BH]|uniref:lipopolysaccharide biosynthesis protein n=1 Tax=Bacteroides sp. OF04-15BH TaxID=2292281 RepID=UPI000E47EBA1|nr:lipopolysaccharide biosynthesis protein [Bacteroides sp. OF04-15BH]RHP65654.1 lipopolysaccharide biosynthesis protein [Bacteroides sp. OF04-15BH]